MSLMTRFVMSAMACTVGGSMLPTSVATSTACATTVSTAGPPFTLPQGLKTIAVSSKKMETDREPSISSPISPALHVQSCESRSVFPSLPSFSFPTCNVFPGYDIHPLHPTLVFRDGSFLLSGIVWSSSHLKDNVYFVSQVATCAEISCIKTIMPIFTYPMIYLAGNIFCLYFFPQSPHSWLSSLLLSSYVNRAQHWAVFLFPPLAPPSTL